MHPYYQTSVLDLIRVWSERRVVLRQSHLACRFMAVTAV